MGCGCSNETDDEVINDEKGMKGPVVSRSCTDIPCLVIFILYFAGFVTIFTIIGCNSDAKIIHHPTDYQKDHCGMGKFKDKPNIYYYDLFKDLKDVGMFKVKGTCVAQCPSNTGDIVEHTDGTTKFVDTPTWEFKPFHRCMPRVATDFNAKALLCAWPSCTGTSTSTEIKSPQDVCGPKGEGAEKYWFMTKPDLSMQKQWEADDVAAEVIEARMGVEYQNKVVDESNKDDVNKYDTPETDLPCDHKVKIMRGISVVYDDGETSEYQKMFKQFSGAMFQGATKLYTNSPWIAGLGIGGAVILSIIIILMYSTCVKVSLCVLVFMMLVVMSLIDYIFFRKAGWNRGKTGGLIASFFVDTFGEKAKGMAAHALRDEQTAVMVPFYKACAVIWSILIFLILCLLCFIQRQIRIVVALTSEAASCLCKMPSLIIFPYFGVATLTACTWMLARTILAIMTLETDFVVSCGSKVGLDMNNDDSHRDVQKALAVVCVLGFLWTYFFHLALFTSVISNCVSDWYFYRDDQESGEYKGRGSAGYFFCKPVLVALKDIFLYNVGTLAFGSFLIAVCSLPRLLLEYIEKELNQSDNPVTEKLLMCFRCCLWCFEKCIKFLTEYAYINNAVTGKPFCRAAHASFVLIAKYPVQVALNTLVTGALRTLSCIFVPGCMIIAAYFVLKEPADKGDGSGSGWGISALFIAILSFTVTRITVGVYEIALTTLFVCAMRDSEDFGCRYAPEALREAMGVKEQEGGQEPPSSSGGEWRSTRAEFQAEMTDVAQES